MSPAKVVLAQGEVLPDAPPETPVEQLLHWLREQNHQRLERIYDIISAETTESGEPIEVVRIPMPELTLDVFQPGDGQYDYFSAYERWEDASTLPGRDAGRLARELPELRAHERPRPRPPFLEARPIKPGKASGRTALPATSSRTYSRDAISSRCASENVVRGGGGMNCITQQQPASAKFELEV